MSHYNGVMMKTSGLILGAVLLAGCQTIPGLPISSESRESGESGESHEAPVQEDQLAEALANGWQNLFESRFDRAMVDFVRVERGAPADSRLQNRARLGQAVTYLDPAWTARDLDAAAARLDRLSAEPMPGEQMSVFDWALTRAAAQWLSAEQARLNLEAELEQARADQAQAEETISRLRELILGQD